MVMIGHLRLPCAPHSVNPAADCPINDRGCPCRKAPAPDRCAPEPQNRPPGKKLSSRHPDRLN
ncbi:hypothetical protein MCA2882 [Methylococcus capsulatus str. Bath]|uniref:Uncharacterized protein n=1 Tax=Methylococcus capsulatus (strain ATCC 33009 / NCIMB 11132 / Bath) TaxID=243233 RepID=Q603C5_METCA|nr:hypothetical protein MCA2882 [Methylococcus capsulatus str. Bath]